MTEKGATLSLYIPKEKSEERIVERLVRLSEEQDRSINYLVVEAIIKYSTGKRKRRLFAHAQVRWTAVTGSRNRLLFPWQRKERYHHLVQLPSIWRSTSCAGRRHYPSGWPPASCARPRQKDLSRHGQDRGRDGPHLPNAGVRRKP